MTARCRCVRPGFLKKEEVRDGGGVVPRVLVERFADVGREPVSLPGHSLAVERLLPVVPQIVEELMQLRRLVRRQDVAAAEKRDLHAAVRAGDVDAARPRWIRA